MQRDALDERIRSVENEIEAAMLEEGEAKDAGDLETWRLWVSKEMLLRTQEHRLREEKRKQPRGCLPSASASCNLTAAGPQRAEPALQDFWRQLAATETLRTFGSTRILNLGSNAHFPKEGSDVQSSLLVRQCYEDLSRMVHDHFAEQFEGLVFIIIGTTGIGKTHFLYFLMRQLARSGKTVVWDKQDADLAVMFSPLGVFQGPLRAFEAALSDEDTWYLVDGKRPLMWEAKTVLISSPDRNVYKDAFKWPDSLLRYMGPWTCEEILAARFHIYNDQSVADVKSIFNKWGGNPRFVFQNTDAASQALLKDALDVFSPGYLTDVMTDNVRSSEPAFDAGNKLLHLTIQGDYFHGPVVFASEWVREELISRFLRLKEHKVRDFIANVWDWGEPNLQAFKKDLRERHRALHGKGKL